MQQPSALQRTGHRMAAPFAGALAGFIAGVAYIAAQMSFHLLMADRSPWEPLQRIAAILLGADAAPPPADISLTLAGFGLVIHLALATVVGRVVELLTRGRTPVGGLLVGALLGLALYALNFLLLAPLAFPWFEGSPVAVTVLDHLLFGATCGTLCVLLREEPAYAAS